MASFPAWLPVLVALLAVLLPLLFLRLSGSAARTELVGVVEQYGHPGPLRALGSKGAEAVARLLGGPEHAFLGTWRHNASLLREVNEKLIRGLPVILDGFLNASLADSLYGEMLLESEAGRLHSRHSSDVEFEATGINISAFGASFAPRDRCRVLAEVGHEFKFRHHACCEAGPPQRLAALRTLEASFAGQWANATNLLLAGSGYRVLGQTMLGSALDQNSFREFRVGDYHLLHTDSLAGRVLTVNYWLATPGWAPEWGGNLLWCGLPQYSDNAGVPPEFPEAQRIPPAFNQAMLFLPHVESIHGVEPVLPSKSADAHRFAFTAWMTVNGLDEQRHWSTFAALARSRQGKRQHAV